MNSKVTRFAVASGLCSLFVMAAWLALGADAQLRINRDPSGSVTLEWDSQTGQVYQVYWNSNVLEGIASHREKRPPVFNRPAS